jgi:hypothetical protein
MTKNTKQSQTALRSPVDALQYEKLALSTFRLCDQQLDQLNRLVSLASTICRCPTMTRDERQSQRALLELLVETAEGYASDLKRDRELYQVIALDAKGVPDSRITARHAASLLANAAKAHAVSTEGSAESVNQVASLKIAPLANAEAQPVTIQ